MGMLSEHKMSEFTQALEYYELGMKITMATCGAEHPYCARMYAHMASVYHAQHDLAKSLEYYEKALKIRLAK